jgi:hypothetical protein
MKGAGYYDQHSTAQLASIRALDDWVEDAVAKLPLPDPAEPVTILDLGSSEGRNAIRVMTNIVAGLRRRTDQSIRTIYSDLATNNFNQLFANLDQARRGSVLAEDVYASVVGGTFYGSLLPPSTVHLATCFNSILWLDQLPAVPMRDSVAYRRPHPPRPGLVVPQEVSAAFERQAEQDLIRFLKWRAKELVPGGKLLVATPADTDEARINDGLSDVLNDACLDLIATGELERAQYERLTMPQYCRTLAEMLAPMERTDSPVRGAFTVDRAQSLEVPTPFSIEFQRTGDVAAYAAGYTGFLRAISEPVVRAAFGQQESESISIERLYDRIRARLQAEPEHYMFRYFMVAVLLTRR